MIGTVLRVSWLNLSRDRVALALTSVLPLIFFSVFAQVFSGLDGAGMQGIRLALIVEQPSMVTSRLQKRFADSNDIHLVAVPSTIEISQPEAIRELIRTGQADVALAIPAEFSARLIARNGDAPEVIWFKRKHSRGSILRGRMCGVADCRAADPPGSPWIGFCHGRGRLYCARA